MNYPSQPEEEGRKLANSLNSRLQDKQNCMEVRRQILSSPDCRYIIGERVEVNAEKMGRIKLQLEKFLNAYEGNSR